VTSRLETLRGAKFSSQQVLKLIVRDADQTKVIIKHCDVWDNSILIFLIGRVTDEN
jgi:hypothetical protein